MRQCSLHKIISWSPRMKGVFTQEQREPCSTQLSPHRCAAGSCLCAFCIKGRYLQGSTRVSFHYLQKQTWGCSCGQGILSILLQNGASWGKVVAASPKRMVLAIAASPQHGIRHQAIPSSVFSPERPALQPFFWLTYLRSHNKNWYMQIGQGYLLFTLNIVFQLNFAFCGDAFLKTRTEHKIPLFKWHILGRYGLRNLAVTYSVCGFYFVRLCGAMNLSCP